jgi:AcrR family transcriptional regulator
MNLQETDIKMRILQSAKSLFAKQGYDGTSVRQICEEAGANIALVSYHYGGKENLFFELFKHFFPSHKLSLYAKELEDPVQGIRLVIQQVIMLRTQDPELVTILQTEIILLSPRVQVLREVAFPVYRKVRELLELGRSEGIYHFESLDSTLMFVLGSIFFYKQRDFFEPLFTEDKPDIDKLIKETSNYVLNGLGYRQS